MTYDKFMSFRIIRSTNLEQLAKCFAEDLSREVTSPLEPEYVVVQTPGMIKWLSLETALRRGSLVRAEMMSPVQLAMKLAFLILRQKEEKSLFEKEVLVWAVYQQLKQVSQASNIGPFRSLRQYLQQDSQNQQTRTFTLAASIADLFDQYLLYRPHWLEAWENGKSLLENFTEGDPETLAETQAWQAELWRQLCRQAQVPHRAQLFEQLTEKLLHESVSNLPVRVSLFGMSLLPPVFLRLFEALGRHCQVTLYLEVPTLDYWGDQASLRVRLRTAQSLEHTGSRLLGEWGKTGRDFMDMLLETEAQDEEPAPESELPDTLLGALQRDIRNNTPPVPSPQDIQEKAWSVRFARCPTPLREVEVLLDLLLEAFRDDETLLPSDVAILSPQLELYQPLLDLTFRNCQATRGVQLPFDLADSVQTDSLFTRWLSEIFQAAQGRFEANEIFSLWELYLELIEEPLTEDERQNTRVLIEKSGIRWGLNGEDKKHWELPPIQALTWEEGLDRLWSAYCFGAGDYHAAEHYAYTAVPEALLTAKLSSFLELLRELVKERETARPLTAWAAVLNTWLEKALAGKGSEEQLKDFLSQTSQLVENVNLAGLENENLNFELAASLWQESLQNDEHKARFFTGKVTIAEMIPLRSLPFRVIALLGMNLGFPRETLRPDYDLTRYSSQPGDRNQLESDRYLFLETLMSARERLILTASGITDKGECAPEASVVTTLLNTLNQDYTLNGQKAGDAITKIYPLQPSSPRYQDSRAELVTFDTRWFINAPPKQASRPLHEWRFPHESSTPLVSLNTIANNLKDPLKTFLSEGAGISFPDEQSTLPSSELFSLDGLGEWKVSHTYSEEYFGKHEALGLLRAEGGLPQGVLGDLFLETQKVKTEDRLNKLKEYTKVEEWKKVRGAQEAWGQKQVWRYTGDWLTNWSEGKVLFQVGKLKVHQRLKGWLAHAFLNLEKPQSTLYWALDGHIHWRPLSKQRAEEILSTLAALAQEACEKPLYFFPEVSWEYLLLEAEEPMSKKSLQRREEFLKLWNKLLDDPWYNRFIESQDWEDFSHKEEFIQLSQTVFGPMKEYEIDPT